VKLAVERVALFKNGLGFFTSTATLPESVTSVELGHLPVPSFGTFWVGYPDKVKVRSLVAAVEKTGKPVPVQSIGQLLQLNPGCKVRLHTGPDGREVIEGTILGDGKVERREAHSGYLGSASGGRVLLVKTDDGIVALNSSSVTRVDFGGCDIIDSAEVEQEQSLLRMQLERPAGGERIGVTYLAKGITWAPSYLIDLLDAQTARLSARALVINEVADLENVALELVTGYPNTKFSEVQSPIGLRGRLADFLKALRSGRTEPTRDQYGLTAQLAMVDATSVIAGSLPPAPIYSSVVEGLVSEDLFLYPVQDFTLMKGQTAWVPLFSAELPYEHIYTWKVGNYLSEDNRYRNRSDGKKAEEVWHSCRLVNSLGMPLTTASAEFMKDGAFVGQDVCYYTAPGAETTIRINRAMNVMAEETEIEIDRTRNAAHFRGSSYDLIKVRGELRLHSRLDKSINMEITKLVSGEILGTVPVAEDVQTAKGLTQVNPKHVLTWEIALDAGEELTLSYTYQVYIRG
jgi:hypothetical protein